MGIARAYMRLLVSRDISVVFSDLVALGYGLGCAVKPRSREAVRRRRRA
jgi:hypothetical protein